MCRWQAPPSSSSASGLLYLIRLCRAAASSALLYHGLVLYRWHRTGSCSRLLLALLIALYAGIWVLLGLFLLSV